MKINKKLLERLDQSLADSFLLKIEQEGQKKVEPEQFIGQQQGSNFRVRQIGEEKEESTNSKKMDAMSTATSNFYKQNNESQVSTRMSFNGSKLLDQGKVFTLKQKLGNRIVSAQPARPLMIKKVNKIENIEQQKEQKFDMKSPIFQLKRRLTSAQKEQPEILERQEENQVENQKDEKQFSLKTTQKPPLQRRFSARKMDDDSEIKPQSECINQFREPKQFLQIKPQKKYEQSKIYEVMDSEVIKEITDAEEDQFDELKKIQFRFNTISDSLYQLGELLPNLVELKLNYSQIESFRLLGTKLRNLKILYITNSKLSDISGISSMPLLEELYASFNNIKDLSALAFHENLVILDIEANEIGDEMQIDYLESLNNLQQLVIAQNPIVNNEGLRTQLYDRIRCEIMMDNYDNGMTQSELVREQEDQQLTKLYNIAQQIDDDFDLHNVDQLRLLESKLRENFDNLIEPDEEQLLALQIKQRPFQDQKQQLSRPQSAIDPTSLLVNGNESFAGNPLKAARQSKIEKNKLEKYDIQSLMNSYK